MKKILSLSLSVVLMAGISSCGGNGNGIDSYNDSASVELTKALADQLGYGSNIGYEQMLASMPAEMRDKMSKEDFLKGFLAALEVDTANLAYYQGFITGLNALEFAINQNSSNGDQIDLKRLYEEFNKAFVKTGLNEGDAFAATTVFKNVVDSLQTIQLLKLKKAQESTPEATANIKAGEEFIQKAKAADSSIKTTESGLSYKIENPGTGAKISKDSNIKMRYVAKTIDGTVFDCDSIGNSTFQLQNFEAGFQEGLMMLGKGGKATLYIPGKLAYGADGIPQAGVGPFSTVIYEIEITETNAPATFVE